MKAMYIFILCNPMSIYIYQQPYSWSEVPFLVWVPSRCAVWWPCEVVTSGTAAMNTGRSHVMVGIVPCGDDENWWWSGLKLGWGTTTPNDDDVNERKNGYGFRVWWCLCTIGMEWWPQQMNDWVDINSEMVMVNGKMWSVTGQGGWKTLWHVWWQEVNWAPPLLPTSGLTGVAKKAPSLAKTTDGLPALPDTSGLFFWQEWLPSPFPEGGTMVLA